MTQKRVDRNDRGTLELEWDRKVLDEMGRFATERMRVWEKKTAGEKPPYTTDPILTNYRFCNIYRELDRQTIEIHQLLADSRDDFEVWLLNMLYCRMVCRAETVRETGLLSFEEANNEVVLAKLRGLPRPKYGTAYVFPISIIMKRDYPTREEFFCRYLPKVARECGRVIRGMKETEGIEGLGGLGVSEVLARVLPVFGFNFRFHWTEVLIDVAYQYPEYIDLFARFPIGPGSKPTMERLNGGRTLRQIRQAHCKQAQGCQPEEVCLQLTREEILGFPYLEYEGKPVRLSGENWEGIGCEYRKYTNLKAGSGRVRRYPSPPPTPRLPPSSRLRRTGRRIKRLRNTRVFF